MRSVLSLTFVFNCRDLLYMYSNNTGTGLFCVVLLFSHGQVVKESGVDRNSLSTLESSVSYYDKNPNL